MDQNGCLAILTKGKKIKLSSDYELKKADIVCVKSYTLIGRLIRFFTRSIGEARTKINHVGIISAGRRRQVQRTGRRWINPNNPGREAKIIEATHMVVEHTLWGAYNARKVKVAIYRPLNISDLDRGMIVKRARHYVGKDYGYLDLVCHLADWFLLGAYVFRRLTDEQSYPICSWIVAEAYSSVGLHFSVEPGQAQPDDIFDFCEKTEGKNYHKVRALKPMEP